MKFYGIVFSIFGLFILAAFTLKSRHEAQLGRPPDSVVLAACKRIILSKIRDPSAVKWNRHDIELREGKVLALIDFTAPNGFGGPVRATWVFTFTPDLESYECITSSGAFFSSDPEK